jgi:hypothetical protein
VRLLELRVSTHRLVSKARDQALLLGAAPVLRKVIVVDVTQRQQGIDSVALVSVALPLPPELARHKEHWRRIHE